jgi:hypothetical protein
MDRRIPVIQLDRYVVGTAFLHRYYDALPLAPQANAVTYV